MSPIFIPVSVYLSVSSLYIVEVNPQDLSYLAPGRETVTMARFDIGLRIILFALCWAV